MLPPGKQPKQLGDYEMFVELFKSFHGPIWGAAKDGDLMAVRPIPMRLPVGKAAAEAIGASAVAARGLSHDRIVAVVDVVTTDRAIGIVSKLVDGVSLAAVRRLMGVRRKPFAPGVALRIIVDVLEGLAWLSDKGYAPGGLTIDGIMVGRNGTSRLLEAPIARDLINVKSYGQHRDVAPYRSPEQLADGDVTPATDVWSMGAMAWELLRNQRLFGGLGYAAIAGKIKDAPIERMDVPSPKHDAIDASIADVMERALTRDGEARYANVDEMLGAMAELPLASHDEVATLISGLMDTTPAMKRVRDAIGERGGFAKASGALIVAMPVSGPSEAVTYKPPAPLVSSPLEIPSAPPPPISGKISEPPPSLAPRALAPANDSTGGRKIGRCELYGEIAHGGMATIHLGRWVGAGGFNRTVAVKVLHEQYARDQDFKNMFLDEARVVARIRHPNVMSTIDLVDEDDQLFIVMDYVHGVTLAHLIRQARRNKEHVPVGVVTRILTGILHGLHAAHEAKDAHNQPLCVIHRDVSPENVLVGADGYAKLIDFGIASAMGRFAKTHAGQIKGKLAYLSPEQITGQPVDRRTDIYSASVVAWQALTTRRLFKAGNIAAVSYKVLNDEIVAPSQLRASVPIALDEVVMKGMSRDSADRWSTAEEMGEALEDAFPMASHREVGRWVREIAKERLDRSAKIVAAVETAPVETEAEDLGRPLSVYPTPDDSIPPGAEGEVGSWGSSQEDDSRTDLTVREPVPVRRSTPEAKPKQKPPALPVVKAAAEPTTKPIPEATADTMAMDRNKVMIVCAAAGVLLVGLVVALSDGEDTQGAAPSSSQTVTTAAATTTTTETKTETVTQTETVTETETETASEVVEELDAGIEEDAGPAPIDKSKQPKYVPRPKDGLPTDI